MGLKYVFAISSGRKPNRWSSESVTKPSKTSHRGSSLATGKGLRGYLEDLPDLVQGQLGAFIIGVGSVFDVSGAMSTRGIERTLGRRRAEALEQDGIALHRDALSVLDAIEFRPDGDVVFHAEEARWEPKSLGAATLAREDRRRERESRRCLREHRLTHENHDRRYVMEVGKSRASNIYDREVDERSDAARQP
jgi:hypothetical protein